MISLILAMQFMKLFLVRCVSPCFLLAYGRFIRRRQPKLNVLIRRSIWLIPLHWLSICTVLFPDVQADALREAAQMGELQERGIWENDWAGRGLLRRQTSYQGGEKRWVPPICWRNEGRTPASEQWALFTSYSLFQCFNTNVTNNTAKTFLDKTSFKWSLTTGTLCYFCILLNVVVLAHENS